MSDYSSMATLQNNSPTTAGFAAALQRARLVAAKLEGGGSKRPLEEGNEPSSKKVASETPFPPQPPMSDISSSGGAGAGAGPRLGAGPPPPPNMMGEQSLIEYIRVPDNMVGLIIGRGGEQITRLQAESGCKIQMAPDSGGQPERMCTLTGSTEAIQRAKDLVNQIVNHRGRENAPKNEGPMGGMGPGPSGPVGGNMPPMGRGGGGGGLGTTDEIMLPGPKVGLIIGKNGKTIKQLQEQSGAKMVVIQDGPNTEYEKPLRISGDPAKVEHAKQLVFELLADKDMGGPGGGGPRQYDDYQGPDQGNGLATNSTEVLVPKVAVGVVIGRGGDMIKKIQSDTGARVQFHQERDDGPGDKRCYLQGKPHQVDAARQMIEDLISSVNRREQERPRPRAPARNGDRGGDFAPWQEQPDVRVTFTVSNVKCGLIIGRGGEVIKQINAQSGAHCELDRRAQGADRNNRTFYIRGHPEAVDHCKRIIMEKVGMPVNFMPDNGNGNGDGNGNGNGGNGNDYYGGGGGGGGGPPAWGYNPHWHQPSQPQQQQQVQINPATGQPDYSQQWIDYYRTLGLVREAEAIEMQQAKQQPPHQPQPPPDLVESDPSEYKADYTLQWIEYYREQGLEDEAKAIEMYLLQKLQDHLTKVNDQLLHMHKKDFEENVTELRPREDFKTEVSDLINRATIVMEQQQETLLESQMDIDNLRLRQQEMLEQMLQEQQQQMAIDERLQSDGFESGPGASGGGGGGGASGGGGADYSAQWAEYYRSIGKMKEAEAIESQIKIKQQQQQQQQPGGAPPAPPPGTPGPAPTPPAAGPMPPYQQYPMYSGGVYPGYAPYPYSQGGDQQQWLKV